MCHSVSLSPSAHPALSPVVFFTPFSPECDTTAGGVDGGGGGWKCPCTPAVFYQPECVSTAGGQTCQSWKGERGREADGERRCQRVTDCGPPLARLQPPPYHRVSAHKSLHSHQHTQVLSALLFSGAVQLLENIQKLQILDNSLTSWS